MDIFAKVVAGILVAVIFNLTLTKTGKDISVLLSLAACIMVATIAMDFLKDIITFMKDLEKLGKLNNGVLAILLKCVGIGLLAEFTSSVCTDSGNGALGKVLQMMGPVLILWLALPLFTQLLELVESILGAV